MPKEPIDFTGFRKGDKDYDVRAARIAAGLSCKELGAMLGVTYSTIKNWERGKAHPRPDMLERIKEVLQERTASTDAPVAEGDLHRPAPSYKTITRTCAVCGREFETRASQPRKTCSEACRGELTGQTHKANRNLGLYIQWEKPTNIKTWEIVSPKGKAYKIRNLEAWAREHCGLYHAHLVRGLEGYKGLVLCHDERFSPGLKRHTVEILRTAHLEQHRFRGLRLR